MYRSGSNYCSAYSSPYNSSRRGAASAREQAVSQDFDRPVSSRSRAIPIRPDIIPKAVPSDYCKENLDSLPTQPSETKERLRFYDTLHRELSAVSEDCKKASSTYREKTGDKEGSFRAEIDRKDAEIAALKAEVASLQEQLFTERNSAFLANEEFLLCENSLKRELRAIRTLFEEEKQGKRRVEALYADLYDRHQCCKGRSDTGLEERFQALERKVMQRDKQVSKPPLSLRIPGSERSHARSYSALGLQR